MTTRALMLGGGGPVGVGWESGLVAGLAGEGLDVAGADLIAGTSAGSIVGAQLALGRDPQEMLATQLSLDESLRGARRDVDLRALMSNFARWFSSELPRDELLKEIGAFALEADTSGEDEWVTSFGSLQRIGAAWLERRFVCTAIDTASGEFLVWDRESGVDLAHAIASSCAVPGVFPPVTIAGRRYMDGGMRSSTNADMANGFEVVVVVSVTAFGTNSASTPGRPAHLVERARRRLETELNVLRESGSAVELIVPDDQSRAAFGANYLDGSRRRASAEEGLRQGRIEAARLREFWS